MGIMIFLCVYTHTNIYLFCIFVCVCTCLFNMGWRLVEPQTSKMYCGSRGSYSVAYNNAEEEWQSLF